MVDTSEGLMAVEVRLVDLGEDLTDFVGTSPVLRTHREMIALPAGGVSLDSLDQIMRQFIGDLFTGKIGDGSLVPMIYANGIEQTHHEQGSGGGSLTVFLQITSERLWEVLGTILATYVATEITRRSDRGD